MLLCQDHVWNYDPISRGLKLSLPMDTRRTSVMCLEL